MISAEEFIEILEKKDLLDPELLVDLRRRVEQSMAPVSAALLAKRLVDKGHLSRKLAQRLLDRAESDVVDTGPVEEAAEEPDNVANLGLAPLEEDDEFEEVADLEMTEDEDWGLQELDDEPAIRATSQPVAKPAQPAVPVQPATPIPSATPLINGLEEIEEIAEPLDGLDDIAMTGDPLEDPLEGARSGRRGKRHRPGKGGKKNVWDSTLLLNGGGALLFLIIVGIVLVFVLSGRGADDMLAQADDYYAQGSYTKAIDSYNQFLDKFPSHQGVGGARVRLSLAKMRQVVSGGDWPKALEVAQAEIQLISGEETFAAVARPELASMLPDIADGLASKAHSTQDGQLADFAEEGLALVEKYVPSSSRPQDRLQDIEGLIELTRREIARGETLAATVAEIVKAAEEGRTQDGYELRRVLLKEYPTLFDDPSLAEAIQIVSKAEQSAVKRVEKSVAAVTDEPESTAVATVGLAQRAVASPIAGVDEHRLFAVAGGAVYGIDAADGKVRWRRDVGFEANVRGPQFPPTPVSERPDADPLLVSRARREILRVEAATGEVRWRFPVGEPFDAHPVVFEDRVLVATNSGRLLSLDLASGNSTDYIELPQPLWVGPVCDAARKTIYQVGEHSSLFVISATDGTCQNVFYLGHEPGTVIVPPVRVSRYLLICENDGVNDSVLQVLDIDPQATGDEETPVPPVKLVQQVRLEGHVHTPPIVSGTEVLLVTDAGAIAVFRLTGAADKDPLSLSAEGKTAGAEMAEMVRYALMAEGRLWIADSQLTQYAVRSSESRLKSSWTANEGSVSLQPPTIVGDAVVQVRHRSGMPGVVVSAVSIREGQSLWETTLAAPAAAAPIVDAATRTIIATTSVGGVFQVSPPTEGQVTLLDRPTKSIPVGELTTPVEQIVRLSNGMIAMVPAGDPMDIPVFQPGKTDDEARIRNILLSDALSGQVTAFHGGLLAPGQSGQVFLVDPQTGAKMAEPFQPQIEAGRKYRWYGPAVIDEDQFVIADDSGGLHRAVVTEQPAKHLASAATVRLDEPVTSSLAVLGNRVYAVDRTDALVRVDLPGLTDKTLQPLGAKCVFGPQTVGQYVVLVTNDNLMHVIDSDGKARIDSLSHGIPTGVPAVDGSQWLLASGQGVIWQVDPGTGEELAKRETALALGSSVVVFGSRLVVAGHDGTLYLIDKP